jgi:AraC family transcriptional regulator
LNKGNLRNARLMAANQPEALAAGSFYGAVRKKHEQCGAIFTDLCHETGRKLPQHSHQLPFFGMLLDGSYRENYVHKERYFDPFTIMFRPSGVPHEDEIGPGGVKFFEIEILPTWQKRLRECSGNLDVACDDCAGGEVLWLAIKLFRETRGPETESRDLAVESLLAELLGVVACPLQARSKDAPAWLRRVVDKLRTDFCERLSLDELSNEAGVHPVHLSRVFRRCTREGIGEYVHRLRVRAACEQMLKPDTTLTDVALEKGFADQSHFTRVFHRVTGMSPGAFRALISGTA